MSSKFRIPSCFAYLQNRNTVQSTRGTTYTNDIEAGVTDKQHPPPPIHKISHRNDKAIFHLYPI